MKAGGEHLVRPEFYRYPAIFKKVENHYEVDFPDLKQHTFGKDLDNALYMAHDLLEGYMYTLEDLELEIPKSSLPNEIKTKGEEFVQLVQIYMPTVRDEENNKLIRTNVSVPNSLKNLAKKEKINLSALLTSALKHKLGLQ